MFTKPKQFPYQVSIISCHTKLKFSRLSCFQNNNKTYGLLNAYASLCTKLGQEHMLEKLMTLKHYIFYTILNQHVPQSHALQYTKVSIIIHAYWQLSD